MKWFTYFQEQIDFKDDTLLNLNNQEIGRISDNEMLNFQGQVLGKIENDDLLNLKGQSIMTVEGKSATSKAKIGLAFFFFLQ